MGREVRKVRKDWQHPKNERGNYKPLFEGYAADSEEFMRLSQENGLREAIEYMGCPDKENYMPDWSEEEATHLMMYETTSEGTPISPAFETAEELARWLTDNGASAFGSSTGTYEGWLRVARGGYACSAVLDSRGFRSGVDAL